MSVEFLYVVLNGCDLRVYFVAGDGCIFFRHHFNVVFKLMPEGLCVGRVAISALTAISFNVVLELNATVYDSCHEFVVLEGGRGPGPSAVTDVWGVSGRVFRFY